MDKNTLQDILDNHSVIALHVTDAEGGANSNQLWIDKDAPPEEVATYNIDDNLIIMHNPTFMPLFKSLGLILSIDVHIDIHDA